MKLSIPGVEKLSSKDLGEGQFTAGRDENKFIRTMRIFPIYQGAADQDVAVAG